MGKKSKSNRRLPRPAVKPSQRPHTELSQCQSTKPSHVPPVRTVSGRVPAGRTLMTRDSFLPGYDSTREPVDKKRRVVVIETDDENNLAVVPLSGSAGRNRTPLPNYLNGTSYYKHFVEIEDNEGNSIRINDKFHECQPNTDVSLFDVDNIKNTVFYRSAPAFVNRDKINKFRGKKNP